MRSLKLLLALYLPCLGALAQTATATPTDNAHATDTGTAQASSAPQSEQQSSLYLEAMQALAEGRKRDASQRLKKMTELEPRHAGAWLDLALIQCELGNGAETERLFKEILARFDPPQEIRDIIAKRRLLGCNAPRWRWNWSAGITRGYEQNVNQGASQPTYSIGSGSNSVELPLSSDFLPKADHYTVLNADAHLDLDDNGRLLQLQWSARRNDLLHQYDNGQLFIGLEQPWRLGDWRLQGSAWFGVMGLGGVLYQKQSQLQLRATVPWRLPPEWQFNLALSASHLHYLTLTNFDANTQELRAQLQYRKEERSAQASLTWLNDHATADRPGGQRHGWLAQASARERLFGNVSGEAAWSHQFWRGSSAYSPGVIEQVRQQNMQTLRLALHWPQGERHAWQLEWRAVRNRENISIFQYNNRQLQLSWQWYSE